jgi:hypothetical protein
MLLHSQRPIAFIVDYLFDAGHGCELLFGQAGMIAHYELAILDFEHVADGGKGEPVDLFNDAELSGAGTLFDELGNRVGDVRPAPIVVRHLARRLAGVAQPSPLRRIGASR